MIAISKYFEKHLELYLSWGYPHFCKFCRETMPACKSLKFCLSWCYPFLLFCRHLAVLSLVCFEFLLLLSSCRDLCSVQGEVYDDTREKRV
jgi:hypothetical protein